MGYKAEAGVENEDLSSGVEVYKKVFGSTVFLTSHILFFKNSLGTASNKNKSWEVWIDIFLHGMF